MLGILNKVFDPTKRTISRYEKKANEIEALAQDFEKLSDEALRNKTIEFKEKLEKGQSVTLMVSPTKNGISFSSSIELNSSTRPRMRLTSCGRRGVAIILRLSSLVSPKKPSTLGILRMIIGI